MKKFDADYKLLEDMYEDGYFPDFLVDKLRDLIENVITFLETGEQDLQKIQEKFDEMTLAANDLEEEFEKNGSELETAARESFPLRQFPVRCHFSQILLPNRWLPVSFRRIFLGFFANPVLRFQGT